VRTTLPDRPGALAALAQACGAADVNILALQIFPAVGAVTDDLVLRTPAGRTASDVVALVAGAGGTGVEATSCTEAALADQPTRYVRAAREVLDHPMSFPEVVGRLFDAGPTSSAPLGPGEPGDVMEVTVGDVVMQVRRRSPFTATEHARGAALADLVSDVLRRAGDREPGGHRLPGRRLGTGVAPDYLVEGASVSAVVEGVVVGLASVLPGDEPTQRAVTLRVDPAWQRRGIGTRLLVDVARLAHAMGAEEVVLSTDAANQAVLPMVLAAGLRGRIRMSGDVLTVRVPVAGLKPLAS
jgi:GNAT superfamily N-acetyltransferase